MRKSRAIAWSIAGLLVIAIGWFLLSRSASQVTYISPGQAMRPPLKGSAAAAVNVEEFSDFQCPACKGAEPVVNDVITTFGDRIKFTYHHYPLVSVHTQAFRAALAAECANDQGKFWEYGDKLFEKQPDFSRNELVEYAKDLGLTVDGDSGFAACLDSRIHTEIIRTDMRDGEQRNISGTPTFFVNGEVVSDWTQLKQVIQGKLLGA
jgi:protein-disulfide isomerase